VLQVLRKNSVHPQHINQLRYELQRTDAGRSGFVTSKLFKDIYRELNIRMPSDDLKMLHDFVKVP
jgi:hypothetical protein